MAAFFAMTGHMDGTDDASALRDLLTDHRGEVERSTALHCDEVLEYWDGRKITAEEVHETLTALRRELALPDN